MPMWANFDPRLGLTDGDTTVDARGPLHWDTDPTATRVRIEITVTDNQGRPASGAGLFSKDQCPTRWRLDAKTRAGERMTRDGAFAFGTVTRVEPRPGTPWPWGQNVALG